MAYQQISIKTVLFASLAGVAVGGPLLVMMGFSFLASLTLFLVASPLLLLFSPLLMAAALLLLGALVGFAVAVGMAYAGVSTLAWITREVSVKGNGKYYGDRVLKHEGKDLAGYFQYKVHENSLASVVRYGA